MDSDRWKQVDDLLQSVMDRPPEERDAFLRQACAGDGSLEREVRSLLSLEPHVGGFLESPAMEVAARDLALQRQETIETSGSLAGQTISHYRVAERLGAGGMGVVWKARDTRLDRFVALKVLPAERMLDPERKRRFVQEAKTASALNHPNIITIYDIDQAGAEGHPVDFIAMEFVPGKALDQSIPRKGLRPMEALNYAIQVADALAAAHAAGIVHRDLKPGNVMVNESGSVKVLDFGLAKLTEQRGMSELARTGTMAEAPKTDRGTIVGTFSYMSPEQAEGKKLDSRTDIFSFGAMLYEMLTGGRAFSGDSMASILSAILRDEPKPAAEIVHGLPRDLDRIVTRCLRKDPNLRYQHAGDLKIDLQQAREELAGGGNAISEQRPGRLTARRWWWLAAVAACLAVSFGLWWRVDAPQAALPFWKMTQLTNDAGLSGIPALSPDGKLVAYSSDRSVDGGQDLYIKQVAGGQPIRLTSDGAGDTTPDFSPDGTKIVFRSNRDGGGIYVIPAFGGEARLLARDGLNPKFSPDGSQVAYWVGTDFIATSVPGSGRLWVVPVAGGPPRRVGANFTSARYPIWSPDGKHLLSIGYTSAKAYESSTLDWWLVAPNGGEAVKTGVYEVLMHAGLRAGDARDTTGSPGTASPRPGCWPAAGNTVMFSMTGGDNRNLWEIGLSPQTGKVTGVLRRLTAGAGNEVDPSSASGGGALAFTNAQTRRDVWLLAFDLDRGTPNGAIERVTQNPAWRERPSLSNNGRYVAFASDQSGQKNIWVRDLETGKESSVAGSSFVQRFPIISPSATRVAFSMFEGGDKTPVYVSAPGGTPEKLCEACLRATDWSRDEKTILVFGGDPYQIDVLDLASHRQTPLLKHPAYPVLHGRFSPDDRWVGFTFRTEPNRGRIMIAPIDGPKPVPQSAWIAIAEVGANDWANWSPDGRTLYFISPRDGHNCLWGQRIDPSSHQPVGEPFPAQHLHGRVSYSPGLGWSAAGGRIAMLLVEETGNIWMMSRSGAR
jgi:eukaryotic-like serine/threonine-protein kinase